MNIRKLKLLITEKLGIPQHRITAEDAMEIAVRFDHSGCRYRVTIDMQVEKIDGVCRAYDDDAKRVERLLRGAEWDGEGLPPVGTECEIKRVADWMPVTIKFISEQHTIFTTFGGTEDCYQTFSLQFRPIRSEADKKRDISVNEMVEVYRNALGSPLNSMGELYDAIAAGKVPGIKLED